MVVLPSTVIESDFYTSKIVVISLQHASIGCCEPEQAPYSRDLDHGFKVSGVCVPFSI